MSNAVSFLPFTLLLLKIVSCSLNSSYVEGYACQLNDGGMGVCTKASECPAVHCGYAYGAKGSCCVCTGKEAIVCCDETQRLSQMACERYKQYYIDDTGGRMDRASIEDEFSYVATLGFIQKNSLESKPKVAWLCGGALISAKYVLTTAHCVTDPKKGSLKKARVGVIASARDKIFDVEEIIPHEDFEPPLKYNDIALVKLAQTISLSSRFLLPCLSMNGRYDKTGSFAVIGWDAATTTGVYQRIQKFNVDFLDECSGYFRGSYFPEGMHDSILCSTYTGTNRTTNPNPDTCMANSGGLLVKEIHDHPVLIGLASFTYRTSCGMRNPSIYTDVSYYLKWIECIVWANEGVIQL